MPDGDVSLGFFEEILGAALGEGSGEAGDVVGAGARECGEIIVAGVVEGLVYRVGDDADDAEVCAGVVLEFAEGVGDDLWFGPLW